MRSTCIEERLFGGKTELLKFMCVANQPFYLLPKEIEELLDKENPKFHPYPWNETPIL